MELQIGQMVRVKPTSTAARFTGSEPLEVKLVSSEGDRVCVATKSRGTHWVKSEDLELVKDEAATAQQ